MPTPAGKTKQEKIVHECRDCKGTGLYSGFCEAQGEAVICVRCEGKGWVEYSYTPFTGRKRRVGVKSIRRSRGSFLATGFGGAGEAMSYAEFQRQIPSTLPPTTKAKPSLALVRSGRAAASTAKKVGAGSRSRA